MQVTIERVDVPESTTAADAADYLGFVDVGNDCALRLWGGDDFVYAAEDQLPWYRESAFRLRMLYLARLDGEPVGRLLVTIPLEEDATTAQVEVQVMPVARRRGIGAALLRQGEELVAEAGRVVVSAYTEHVGVGIPPHQRVIRPGPPGGVEADDRMRSPGPLDTRGGGVRTAALPADDDSVRFALAHGYRLGQVEVMSRLMLPLADAVARRLQADADTHAAGYRMVTWWGRCPEELVDGYAAARQQMVLEVPHDGVTLDGEHWSVQRVREHEQRTIDSGEPTLVSAAVHEHTGEVAAYTIMLVAERSTKVEQEDTLVIAAHRGHRLGLAVKLANLRALGDRAPHVERVLTWNADENAHMRSINEALGFELVSLEGAWQKHIG